MRIFIISFLTVGLILLASSIGLSIHTKQFIESAITTDGIVIDLERQNGSYHPVVTFTTPDNITFQFTSNTGSSPPAYVIGQQVKVIYDPTSPSKARMGDFWSLWGLAVIFGGLGFPCFLFGFGALLHERLRQRTNRRLRVSGVRIETKFVRVELNRSVEKNGVHPYVIVSQWEKENEIYIFRSEDIWLFNPSDFIKDDKITVFVDPRVFTDPRSMKKYYMDISFLPTLK